jgi:hypothetical protein
LLKIGYAHAFVLEPVLERLLLFGFATWHWLRSRLDQDDYSGWRWIPLYLFALIWSRADVIGRFSSNVVSFSRNVVLSGLSFSVNLIPKPRMLSVRGDYVLRALHLAFVGAVILRIRFLVGSLLPECYDRQH